MKAIILALLYSLGAYLVLEPIPTYCQHEFLFEDLSGFGQNRPNRPKQILPTYPFERERCWLDVGTDWETRSYPSSLNGGARIVDLLSAGDIEAAQNDLVKTGQLSAQEIKFLPKLLLLLVEKEALEAKGANSSSSNYEEKSGEEPTTYPSDERKEPELVVQLREAHPSDRPLLCIAAIQTEVAFVLGERGERLPDPKLGFFEMGMDSLMAVELKKRMEAKLGIILNATVVFNYKNIESVAGYLIKDVLGLATPASGRERSKDAGANSGTNSEELAALKELSEEETRASIVE